MKTGTKVKICGLRETEDMVAAAEAGADFVGIIFAPGKRQVMPEKAAAMVAAVRKLDRKPLVVGVFVNMPGQEVNRIAEECGLDLVQLSGDEDFYYCLDIEKPVIKVIHVTEDMTADDVLYDIEQGFELLQENDVMYLLDTKTGDAYGGTGQSFSREVAAGVAEKMPVVIAGGLTPDTIKALVEEVRPWCVDVSSGVETDGKKDIAKIKDFIAEVQAVAGG